MTQTDTNVTYVDQTKHEAKEIFFKFPKELLTDKRFADLSNDAKLLYSFLYNRCIFSAANGLVEDAHAFAICRMEQMSSILGRSDTKSRNAVNELKKANLIEVRRPGQGKPNRIFVKNYAVSSFPYLDGTEGLTENFYKLPWKLIADHNHLSSNAKLLYILLLDKLSFAHSNHWTDSDGRNYVYYPIDKTSEMLNVNRRTVIRTFKELADNELIITIRQGQGKHNRIYICGHEFSTNETVKSVTSKPEFSTKETIKSVTSELDSNSEVTNMRVKKCQINASGSDKNEVQEVTETRFPIDNKNQNNKTCLSDPSNQTPNAERSERDSRTSKEKENDLSSITEQIKKQINYSWYKTVFSNSFASHRTKAVSLKQVDYVVDILANAVLTARENGSIQLSKTGRTVTKDDIEERFLRRLSKHHIQYFFDKFDKNKVVNVRAYTLPAMYNAIDDAEMFAEKKGSFDVDLWYEYALSCDPTKIDWDSD